MKRQSYAKILSANDTGATGTHQAGILVPKADAGLLAFFPTLDASVKNPDAWIRCEDASGEVWEMRFIYYNNKLHVRNGTRNEYRVTWMTKYLRANKAGAGDSVIFEATDEPSYYKISVATSARSSTDRKQGVIKLAGWRRIH
jgi:hypothetical protein